MQYKTVIVSITIVMLFQTTLWARQLSQQQALQDIANCQSTIELVSLKHEHISALIDLLQPSAWNVTTKEFDFFVREVKLERELLDQHILQLGSRGHNLKNQVKEIKDEHCHPCLASNIRHFCRNVNLAHTNMSRNLEELYQNIRENAGAFSSNIISYAQRQVSTAQEHSSAQEITRAQVMVEEAKEKVNQRKHLLAVERCFEIFRTVQPLLATESED